MHDLFVERAEASEASEPLRRTTLGEPDATTNAAGDAKRKPKNENVGIRWKLNVDGTPVRGLPPTRLSSDAVSGAVAWSAASRLALRGARPGPAREASLARETEDMRDMAARLRPAVSLDPLGWGMQMWESQWVPAATELAERGAPEWSAFAAALRASARVPGGDFASGRLGELPFRVYGAFLGARVGGRGDLAETAAHAARGGGGGARRSGFETLGCGVVLAFRRPHRHKPRDARVGAGPAGVPPAGGRAVHLLGRALGSARDGGEAYLERQTLARSRQTLGHHRHGGWLLEPPPKTFQKGETTYRKDRFEHFRYT